ncbi:MAG: type VII secretion-associated protein [Corynebacterium sp.]|nr:type VII secretion-associated protein [Corynebacterium sp.]
MSCGRGDPVEEAEVDSYPALNPVLLGSSVTPGVVQLTIVEAASIIEYGDLPATCRYDLPAAGIREGWALEALWQQCADSAQLDWPIVEDTVGIGGFEVAIHADPDIFELLEISAAHYGIKIYNARVDNARFDNAEAYSEQCDAHVDYPTPVYAGQPQREWLSYILIGFLLLGVGAGCIWLALQVTSAGNTEPDMEPDRVAAAESVTSANMSSQVVPTTSASSSAAPTTELERYTHPGLSVELPPGYSLGASPNDPAVIWAQGEATDFRILFARDAVYGMPPDLVEEELDRLIKADESLRLTPAFSSRKDIVSYTEVAPDGSHTVWAAWSDEEFLYSIGCQAKTQMSLPQQAACRLAQDSAIFE